MERFRDRQVAGRMLGERLAAEPPPHPVVLGLPRGGVPVAAEIAVALEAPLDVLVVRKVGVPWHPEVAMGAVGEDGAAVWNDAVIAAARVSPREVEKAAALQRTEVQQRVARFRGGRPAVDLRGRAAIVVDDGVATGATAKAGCRIARERGASLVLLSVPVAAPDALRALADVADDITCLHAPAGFMAVGMHYVDFRQVDDGEVVALLRAARA